jgi:hypothetical protein
MMSYTKVNLYSELPVSKRYVSLVTREVLILKILSDVEAATQHNMSNKR